MAAFSHTPTLLTPSVYSSILSKRYAKLVQSCYQHLSSQIFKIYSTMLSTCRHIIFTYSSRQYFLFFSSLFSIFFLQIENNATIIQGIKGLESGVFFDNLMPSFLEVRRRSQFVCSVMMFSSSLIRPCQTFSFQQLLWVSIHFFFFSKITNQQSRCVNKFFGCLKIVYYSDKGARRIP